MLLFSILTHSQNYILEVDSDELFTLKDNEKILTTSNFKESVAFCLDYSYYLDKKNKTIYLLTSRMVGFPEDGKININYCLSVFLIENNNYNLKNCHEITTSEKHRLKFEISDGSLLIKDGEIIKQKPLDLINKNSNWWL